MQENRILTRNWSEYIPENHNIVKRAYIDSKKLYQAFSEFKKYGLDIKKRTIQNDISIRSIVTTLKRDVLNPRQLFFDFKKYRMYREMINSKNQNKQLIKKEVL
jgi:hypothetical protein